MRRIDISNQRFGRLVAQEFVGRKENGNAIWRCVCDCGTVRDFDSYSIRRGITQSCGCLKIECSRERYLRDERFQANIGNVRNLQRDDGVYWASLRLGKKNRSGVVGVSYDNSKRKWTARMVYKGRYVLLQDFDDFDEAVQARRTSERLYLKQIAE